MFREGEEDCGTGVAQVGRSGFGSMSREGTYHETV